MSASPQLDSLISSYFADTPTLKWSYIGFLDAMKPHLDSIQGPLEKRKSIWRKRFLIYLKYVLDKEKEQELQDGNSKTRSEMANLLIQQVCQSSTYLKLTKNEMCIDLRVVTTWPGYRVTFPGATFYELSAVTYPQGSDDLAGEWGGVPPCNRRRVTFP